MVAIVSTIVALVLSVVMALCNPAKAGKLLIDCEDYEFKTPCYTIDEGHERIVLNYDPYSYVNLS